MELKKYYEDPHTLHVGTMPRHTYFIPYGNADDALAGIREKSDRFTLLNGEWHFAAYTELRRVPDAIVSPAAKLSSFGSMPVPACVQAHGYDDSCAPDDALPIPLDPPYIPAKTPVFVYAREVELDRENDDYHIYLTLEGVSGACYLYVNGKCAGYHADSRAAAEFDITPFVRHGNNRLVLLVLKWSSATYTENPDSWYFSGIMRDVYLTRRPAGAIRDLRLTPILSPLLDRGVLHIEAEALCPEQMELQVFSPGGELLGCTHPEEDGTAEFAVENPGLWTAETPLLYTVLCRYNGEYTAHSCGFRQIGFRDEKFYVNQRPVALKGVNYTCCPPPGSDTLTYRDMKKAVLTMKRCNINTVYLCSGPVDPHFLELCDRFGLYVVAQANIYTLAFPEADNPLLCRLEYRDLLLDRQESLVAPSYNHPCVVMWSAGRTGGAGSNLRFAMEQLRLLDPTRPVTVNGLAPCEEPWHLLNADDLHRLKAAYAPFTVEEQDLLQGEFTLTNQLDFSFFSHFEILFEVTRYGKVVQSGSIGVVPVTPHASEVLHLPYRLPIDGDCYLRLIVKTFGDCLWAQSGHEIGFAQFRLPTPAETADVQLDFAPAVLDETGWDLTISANGCSYVINKATGCLSSVLCLQRELLNEETRWDTEPEMPAMQCRCDSIAIRGEEQLIHVDCRIVPARPAEVPYNSFVLSYTFNGDGSLRIRSSAARQGLRLILPLAFRFDRLRYFGYGPGANYNDQTDGTYAGAFSAVLSDPDTPATGSHRIFMAKFADETGLGLALLNPEGVDVDIRTGEGILLSVACGDNQTTTLRPFTKDDSVLLTYLEDQHNTKE